ncbi:MAG: ectonucleotide pyrophosphatase/phosphodiesterase [Bacteroidetes bacterium]|nr:ectonucleotide pyrophosphatase/phosphodiesterase [Bacteroidota bacterium]
MLKKIAFIGIILLITIIQLFAQQKTEKQPYLIVISLDGFRWDYPEIYHLIHFDSIAKMGVKAHSVQPCFPTVTFPNHYSIATGLYPEHHGIVQNKFYDPALNLIYRIGDRKMVMDGRFYKGEPIWVTAEQQRLKSASFYWVGSEAVIKAVQPFYWKPYENKLPFNQRIDTLINWLQLPEKERPHLILFYLPEPDECSHDNGPVSPQTKAMVTTLDSLLWVLVVKIKSLPIGNQVNLIITSDHGMSAVSKDKNIMIDNYLKPQWIKGMYGYNPGYNIRVNVNCIDSVYNALKIIPNLKVWKIKDVPQRLHYNKNQRIGDIVILADSSWSISRNTDKPVKGGTHGYDNDNMDMHGIFYAFGPAFKQNYSRNTFPNIHLYALMAYILHLKPAKTDGKLSEIKDIVR